MEVKTVKKKDMDIFNNVKQIYIPTVIYQFKIIPFIKNVVLLKIV